MRGERHVCLICEANASYGFDWHEPVGGIMTKVRHWYCLAHKAVGAEMMAQKKGAA